MFGCVGRVYVSGWDIDVWISGWMWVSVCVREDEGMCEYMGSVWVWGYVVMRVWVCGCVDVWVGGCVGVWMCG